MIDFGVSLSRRYWVGIVSVPFAALSGVALAAEPTTPDVFLDAMSGCLDWIAEGAPDTVPFDGWMVETAFPTGTSASGAQAGAYRDPAGGLTVSLERSADAVTCAGQEGGVTLDAIGQSFNDWVATESQAGRIGVVAQGAGEFGYAMAVCVGMKGGADVIRAGDESLIFYFNTGAVVPPGGVCDA